MTRSDLESCTGRLLLAAALGVGLSAPARAGSADDDLQAVKKAVLASSGSPASVSQARPPAEDPGPRTAEARPEPRPTEGPLWFRVRIVEKAGKRARLSLNLPIGLVRSVGDEWPIPSRHHCRKRDRCGVTLGEILRALDSGQALVDIEDDEATVRVWVE
jgi:hypothetical protein